MSVKIIVDTSSQYTKQTAENQDICVIPMPVISHESSKELFSGDISCEDFYNNMLDGKVYTTAHVALSIYLEYFEKFYEQKQEAIYFCLSSGLTSSYNTSLIAINELNEKYGRQYVYSYDTKAATAGIDLMVSYVQKGIKKGYNVQRLIEIADDVKKNIRMYLCVSDLKYLYRGGRISKTSAFVGNALSLRLIIELNPKNGKLELLDKVRGTKKLTKKLAEIAKQDCEGNKPVTPMFLCYCKESQMFDEIKQMYMQEYNLSENDLIIGPTCIIIGAHTGPGSAYIFYLKKEITI